MNRTTLIGLLVAARFAMHTHIVSFLIDGQTPDGLKTYTLENLFFFLSSSLTCLVTRAWLRALIQSPVEKKTF